MTQKLLIFTGIIFIMIIVGMVRYAAMLQSERSAQSIAPVPITEQLVDPVPMNLPDGVMYTSQFSVPVSGSIKETDLLHTIELSDIRQGCFRQDCIPSIESTQFVAATELADVLEPDSLGLVLWDAGRFYPFPMLETRELVNETLPDGSHVLISYCPLCGTGIVFNREIDGVIEEFGVSGMLWQSNLLMYNRRDSLDEQNLWSQVLGQAVVGDRAGKELQVLPSDIITYADWLETNPEGETLVSGEPQDPYNGDYYNVALNFAPDFEEASSAIEPNTYVHGVVVNGQPKAYVSDALFDGMTDIVNGERIFVNSSEGKVSFIQSNAEQAIPPTVLPDKEGFWFSWQAAYPETDLWIGE